MFFRIFRTLISSQKSCRCRTRITWNASLCHAVRIKHFKWMYTGNLPSFGFMNGLHEAKFSASCDAHNSVGMGYDGSGRWCIFGVGCAGNVRWENSGTALERTGTPQEHPREHPCIPCIPTPSLHPRHLLAEHSLSAPQQHCRKTTGIPRYHPGTCLAQPVRIDGRNTQHSRESGTLRA